MVSLPDSFPKGALPTLWRVGCTVGGESCNAYSSLKNIYVLSLLSSAVLSTYIYDAEQPSTKIVNISYILLKGLLKVMNFVKAQVPECRGLYGTIDRLSLVSLVLWFFL